MLKVLGIIPARFASTRFPGKPLVSIYGKSMIQRVYEQALQSKILHKVIVATDDDKIFTEVENFGGNVEMTSSKHKNGTERCAEVLSKTNEKFDVIINIQGDEPFFEPRILEQLSQCFFNEKTENGTPTFKIKYTMIDKNGEEAPRYSLEAFTLGEAKFQRDVSLQNGTYLNLFR